MSFTIRPKEAERDLSSFQNLHDMDIEQNGARQGMAKHEDFGTQLFR
jgi:hypothetical protein